MSEAIKKADIAKVESSFFPLPTSGRGRVLFLPALPCLASADAAALERPAVSVFDDDVIRRKQMARLAGCEHVFDDRPLCAMMSRIAAGSADADLELPGSDLVALWDRPDEGLPEQALRRPLPVFGSEHAIAFLAESAIPNPASAARNCNSFHQAFGTDDLHCGPPSIRWSGRARNSATSSHV